MSKYDYEFEYDSVYCYPGSDILRNKMGIKDQDKLSKIERDVSFIKTTELMKNSSCVSFTTEHLCSIHAFLFGNLYDWAGQIRTVDISKGASFCKHEYVLSNLDNVFRQMSKEDFRSMGKDRLARTLAHYLGEINAIHPFREGNGRTQRAFVNQVALMNGYYLDFSLITDDEMLEASHHSFFVDDSKMESLFLKIIHEAN
ncbi:Fic family protein [Methanomassiliicoccaceae archaeon COG_1]|nr:Fic family protein [Methanomassiliicoccaceae archaeon COG_1]